MKAHDLGELAFRNLREAVLRNTLTTLGVAVGIASLVAMLSLGVGLQELATKRLSNSGLFDSVIVFSRSTCGVSAVPRGPARRSSRRAPSTIRPSRRCSACPTWSRCIPRSASLPR